MRVMPRTATTTRPSKRPAPPAAEAALRKKSRALRAAFDAAKKELDRLKSQGSGAFDLLWEAVARIVDEELYLGGGYTSVEAFIAAELPGETRRTVRRKVLVARSFRPADETRHGISFLEEAALLAADLAGAAEAPRAIDLDRLKVPVREPGGRTRLKPARDVTVEELRKARRGLRKGGRTARDQSPAETALRRALAREKALRGVTLRTSRTEVSLGHVPLAALPALARALARIKLPAGEG
jgi:hypothetical protein